MHKYVVGLLFNTSRTFLALVEKQKPEWQAGLFNGVGGKLEPGETPLDAMVREFQEETGVTVPASEWGHFCTIHNEHFECSFYRAFSESLWSVKSVEVERIVIADLDLLPTLPLLPNLAWLVPLALDRTVQVEDDLRIRVV